MQRMARSGKRIAAAVALLGWCALGAAGQATDGAASVTGQVVDTGGKPVAGIVLMLNRTSIDPADPTPGVFLATSRADGSYTMGAVPAGEYNLCASDDTLRYLNPC